MKAAITTLILLFGILPGFGELLFSHTFIARTGEPLSEILIRVAPMEGNPGEAVAKRTESDGSISITLEDGEWFIEVDERELLERGFFCVPGSCFSETCQPVFIDAVPLTPILGLNRSAAGSVSVVAEFDWIEGIDPILYRRYRIERSTDMVTWEPLSSMLLSNPPIRIIDPKAAGEKAVYYRAVEEPSFQVREFPWGIGLDDSL